MNRTPTNEANLLEEHTRTNDSPLNAVISTEEVLKCVKMLKNGKACGYDQILNEYIKCSISTQHELFTAIFNFVLFKGLVPAEWSIGVIMPLYKGKGCRDNVDSYRGITLLSCLGKLFTLILNERLTTALITEEQAGFREGYSTVDHVFTLDFITRYYIDKGQRLYVAFVDYRKAFDTIDRPLLWKKLIEAGITGPVLNAIFKLYENAKSCVKYNNTVSEFFSSTTGVRQGENLSPLLFAVFLNDLISVLYEHSYGLSALLEDVNLSMPNNDSINRMKLHTLLYADDTVLMAESPDQLQSALNTMAEYCDRNNLAVNPQKTNVMVFSRGKVRNLPVLLYRGERLDVVHVFPYLGVNFNYNAKLKVAQKELLGKATKAMFSVIGKARKLMLPVDIQITLFDSLVKPVVMYGAEVWGPQNCQLADKLQIRFLKLTLGLSKYTPTVMVRGETGVYPISLDITARVLNYWFKMVKCGNSSKISNIIYETMLSMYHTDRYKHHWIIFVKNTLDKLDMSFMFDNQAEGVNFEWFKHAVKVRLTDQYKQEWYSEMYDNYNCVNYRVFKTRVRF
jgi:hypothetical protein